MKWRVLCASGIFIAGLVVSACVTPRDEPLRADTGVGANSPGGGGKGGNVGGGSLPRGGDLADGPQGPDQDPGAGCGKVCKITGKPCRAGILDCSVVGPPSCVESSDVESGTACGAGMVCNTGACVPCSDGMPCTPANKCHTGTLTCAGVVCIDSGTNAPDNTACDGTGVCVAGACQACGPTTKPTCDGQSRKECVAGTFKSTTCERGCAAGECCGDGKEAVGGACVDCGGDNQPCCKTGRPECAATLGCMGGRCLALCGPLTACQSGDGCCPPGDKCNASTDGDCAAKCGNMVVEQGEMCDPCPTAATCMSQGCNLKMLRGTGCNAECVESTQGQCKNGDGCCPGSCNNTNDNDCAARCGNGVVEKGETCDGNCPTSCSDSQCQLRKLQGSSQQCNAKCVDDGTIKSCTTGDRCCPSGCGHSQDGDCPQQNAGSKCGAETDCKNTLTCTSDGFCCPRSCFDMPGTGCEKGSCVREEGQPCGGSEGKCRSNASCVGMDGHCSNDVTVVCTANANCPGGSCQFVEHICVPK